MPRREVGRRSKNWEISTSPDVYDEVLRSKHSLLVESAKPHFDRIAELYNRIAPLLDEHGIVGAVRGLYRSFMEELYRATRLHGGQTLQKKANAIASKYQGYGCQFEVLREIANVFGIKIEEISGKPTVTKTTRLITMGMA